MLTDLKLKKNENPQLYNLYLEEITLIYQFEARTNKTFTFTKGYHSEIILECIKWLFIEQDITYWHYSGRKMFYDSIKSI